MPGNDFRKRSRHIPFAREGLPYVSAAGFATLVSAVSHWHPVTVILLTVTLLMVHFFRDPVRWSNAEAGEVICPADGRIIAVEKQEETCFTDRPMWKISIFMNIFDVHVNRVPVSGRVAGLHYRKGRFLAANKKRAGLENEQNWLWIQTDSGSDVVLTQVAGLIARRIVCWPRVGDSVLRGERFGMIRFGSRVDVYIPLEGEVLVTKGQKVFAGETILCRIQ
ncbi:phosphatidylserine decarboxylase [Desulfacinum hydrothermale DSM 13146]|uniref:Phosphatidylserine decarboxylase proenzyme n=1 Tax=Desulfacinum hydrothermale DSM 13146 TaxID=1121390 RepID=A0A1W1XJA8_9BACT|nr:phosphatidylserine decarboxylase family protein [Desulfacinum hydrothermale]SMC24076.1 phosphatidylserine decarboxylase [Desulfacinum hydrothermale DSM 13146]